MQNNNGVKQRFLDCFLKLLDKKRKKMARTTPRPVLASSDLRGCKYIYVDGYINENV